MDTPNRRTSSAHAACSRAGTWAAWAEVVRQLGVSNLEKNYIFGILIIGGHGSWVKGGVYTLGVSKNNFRPPLAAKNLPPPWALGPTS